jgi:heat shock protein HslJ
MFRRTGTTWALRALAVPAVLLLALSGCGNDSVDQAGDPQASGSPAANETVPAGDFLATSVTQNGTPRALVSGTRIALTFTDGQVRANAGCNTMSGPARFEAGTLVVTDLAQTDMGCPGDGRYEQDQFVAGFLTARPAYSYDGTTLDLRTADVRLVLGPRKSVLPDRPLEGTRWDVTHVTQGPARGNEDPDAAVSAGAAPANAYLQFADGKLTGNDGCNSLFGDATVSGDTITFGPVGTTKKACPGMTGMDQVRAVLTGDVTWKIDDTILTLTNADGAGLQLQAHDHASTGPGTGPSTGPSTGSGDLVTPPCCKPMVGEGGGSAPSSGGADGSTGSGGAPTQVNPAGPAEPPPGY